MAVRARHRVELPDEPFVLLLVYLEADLPVRGVLQVVERVTHRDAR